MLQTDQMTSGAPPQYGSGDPVNVRAMMTEPEVTQDKSQVRGVQDVELDCLMVVTRQEHVNLGGLVGDCSQDIAV